VFRNLILLTATLGISLVAGELGLRVVTPLPITEQSHTVFHPGLGYVLDPSLPDIDRRGFRNPRALRQSDLVTIGDSHTYGVNVPSHESWPQQLARNLDRQVYNMGVGSHNLFQYVYALHLALQLHPRDVVLGLYLANDIPQSGACPMLELLEWRRAVPVDSLDTHHCQGLPERPRSTGVWDRARRMLSRTTVGNALSLIARRTILPIPAYRFEHQGYNVRVAQHRVASAAHRLTEAGRQGGHQQRASLAAVDGTDGLACERRVLHSPDSLTRESR
jgi:hypothetical protein